MSDDGRSMVEVLVTGDEGSTAQRRLVEDRVLPRFAAWCRRLGLSVRAVRASKAATRSSARLEVRLPVLARSPRLGLADQIYADLCASAAARHPDRLAAAMESRLQAPDQQPTTIMPMPVSPALHGSAPASPPPPRVTGGSHPTRYSPNIRFLLDVRTRGSCKKHRVVARRITFGRVPSCDVTLPDPTVSRQHALLEVLPSGDVIVTDTGSGNGVLVNGQRVTRVILSSGDVMVLGDSEVRVTFPTAP